MTEEKIAVRAENFTKKYGAFTACSNIDFTAERKSVTGILGLNGAGKSTFLKALSGQFYGDGGSLSVNGKSFPEEIRMKTSFSQENPSLDLSLYVMEILEHSSYSSNLSFSEKKELIKKTVEYFELKSVLEKKASSLSKGFLQRLSLASSYCTGKEVLIFDEISSGLDPSQVKKLRNTIKAISKERCVILSTHNIEEASLLCSKIYIMSKGRFISSGTAEEIIRESGMNNLEDAFISLTGEECNA